MNSRKNFPFLYLDEKSYTEEAEKPKPMRRFGKTIKCTLGSSAARGKAD